MTEGAKGMTDSRIARQPSSQDPKELRIRELLEKELASTGWARQSIDQSRDVQKHFLTDVFSCQDGPDVNRKRSVTLSEYRKVINELNRINNSHIVKGEGNLDKVKDAKGVIIVTNHLGMAKLTRIDNTRKIFPIELDEIEAFPIRSAALDLIAQKLGADLHETAVELPGKLLDIQLDCGAVTVAAQGSGRTERLITDVENYLITEPKSVFVMYPEGGTSGKRNEGGPYDLDEFHLGAFVVAAKTHLPILPVVQKFDPVNGLELRILEPLSLIEADLVDQANLASLMEQTKHKMQAALRIE